MSDRVVIGKKFDVDGNEIGDATTSKEKHDRRMAASEAGKNYEARRDERKAALEEKWPNWWDFANDMALRGADVVLEERRKIIEDDLPKVPKPEEVVT